MAIEPKIIFEDDNILVLDKPAGWIVNEAETTVKKLVVQSWLKQKFSYSLAKSREMRSGIVHRLDKETSGILIVAKTQAAFRNLQSQFSNREVVKTYIALVHGKLQPDKGEVKAPVGRLPWNRERFGVLAGGREALTSYVVMSRFQDPETRNIYSLVEFYPKTGRTHQIRIHAKYLGHPVVSDSFYAGRKTARKDRKVFPRLFLHARSISFRRPKVGKMLSFESDLPDDLERSLSLLEKIQQTP